jgi:hypothetical protein
MNVSDVGRYAMAVTSSGILALALSGCAIRSTSAMPASPVSVEDAPPKSRTFNYTGKLQTFIVPAGVTRLTITASGASGGTIGSYTGGRGGLVKAAISVTPGESLSVFVGERGRTGFRRSFNGGGAGSGRRHHRSGEGGGAADVRLDTGLRILIAGGGGGAGSASGEHTQRDSDLRSASYGYAQGGDGGGMRADDGGPGTAGDYEAAGGRGGGGGAQTAGGNGGHGRSGNSCSGGTGGTGVRHLGGNGGSDGGSSCYAGGGGGGGGKYGGGGGGGPAMNCGSTYYGEFGYCAWGGGGGGGGGSSFIEKSATGIENVKGGAPSGDGRVVISW